jgi:hypothetical protein
MQVGEKTPYYLFHPHVAVRIHDLLPDVKLIVVLRNPTDRAISHYFHEIRWSNEELPIMDALKSEEQRVGPELEKMMKDKFYWSRAHQSFTYKQRGVYVEQLQQYLKYFGRDQLHIINSDRLFSHPHEVLKDVFEFIGVDPHIDIPDVSPRYVGSNKDNVPAEVYEYLNEFFRPYNKKLYELTGAEFGW